MYAQALMPVKSMQKLEDLDRSPLTYRLSGSKLYYLSAHCIVMLFADRSLNSTEFGVCSTIEVSRCAILNIYEVYVRENTRSKLLLISSIGIPQGTPYSMIFVQFSKPQKANFLPKGRKAILVATILHLQVSFQQFNNFVSTGVVWNMLLLSNFLHISLPLLPGSIIASLTC